MDEINELIEGILIDTGSEALGAVAGIGMLWGLFFAGGFTVFYMVLDALAGTI